MDTSYHRITGTPISRWINIRTPRSLTHSSLDHGHTHLQMNGYSHLVINGYTHLRMLDTLVPLVKGYKRPLIPDTHICRWRDTLTSGSMVTLLTLARLRLLLRLDTQSLHPSFFFYFPMYFIREKFCTVWQDFILLPNQHSPPTRLLIAIVATSRPEILAGLL